MKSSISLYPRLNDQVASSMFTTSTPRFYYTKEGVENELTVDTDIKPYSISDPKGYWFADDYNLTIEWEVKCGYTKALYDHSSVLSVACHDAKIGIALQWSSQNSRQRGTVPFGVIEGTNYDQVITCRHSFPKAAFRGNLDFKLILYIYEAGNPDEDEMHYANTEGVIIGEIESFSVQLDGNGSFFAIFEASRPDEPLWSVEYDIDDPATDSFSEQVNITINNAHRNYQFLNRDNKKFDQQLFIEVMANAMATVIETIRQQDESFECLEDPAEGSVAQAVLYFRDVLGWNLSSPLKLSQSIRYYLEQNMKQL